MLKWSIEGLLDQERSYTEPGWIGNPPDEMDSGVGEHGGICITDVHHDAPLFLSFSLSVFMSRLCTFITTERRPWKNGRPKSCMTWVTCSCGGTACWKTRVYDANLERRFIQKLKTNLQKSKTKPSLHRFIVCFYSFSVELRCNKGEDSQPSADWLSVLNYIFIARNQLTTASICVHKILLSIKHILSDGMWEHSCNFQILFQLLWSICTLFRRS